MFNRRKFLGTMAVGSAALGLSSMGFAQAMGADQKFMFIFARGGWDPLCVFAPKFGTEYIDMETGASAYSVAGHQLVDHAGRPNVRAYFEQYGAETAIINGLSTRSVSHEVCTVVATTGSTLGNTPDWSSLVAQGGRLAYSVPSLVLGGPSFPGPLEVLVSRSGEQLQGLISHGFPDNLDRGQGQRPRLRPFGGLLDRFVRQRVDQIQGAVNSSRKRALYQDVSASIRRMQTLQEVDGTLNLAAAILVSRSMRPSQP